MVSIIDRSDSDRLSLRNSASAFSDYPNTDAQKEEWRKSIRETVEKAIASKVEQRLDTPPLERMRRRQKEARLKKEEQMRVFLVVVSFLWHGDSFNCQLILITKRDPLNGVFLEKIEF